MKDFNIIFKENMFVYAAENANNPSSLKVCIPEVFLDKGTGAANIRKLNRGNTGVYLNDIPPALRTTVDSMNYITLPVISNFYCRVDDYYKSSYGEVKGSKDIVSGIGHVNVGDRLVASFIGGNPKNGIIIARC